MRLRLAFVCTLVVSSACGGDDGPDGQADSSDPAPLCTYQFYQSFVIDHAEILPEGEGLDIDGDETPDNALGFLGDAANIGWQASIDDGTIIALLDVRIPSRAGEEPLFALYPGMDSDSPANAEDNFTGQEAFLISRQEFDLQCLSSGMFPDTEMVGEILHAHANQWAVFFPVTDDVILDDASATVEITGGGAGAEVNATAVWTLCSLSTYMFLEGGDIDTGSMLNVLVNTYVKQPDIDVDGDGLETLTGDGDGIVECVDGDGTVIPSKYCPCDPRMQDGYSLAVRATAVPARIAGVVER